MNNIMKFAVVITYSFDSEVPVFLFEDEDSAKLFLAENFLQECKIDMEENGYDTDSEIGEDGWYAKIINHFSDRDDVTEYRIGIIQ